MVILGIDPGLAATGWGVIRPSEKNIPPRFGCIVTKPAFTLVERLAQLAAELKSLIEDVRPEACAIEEIFFAKDSRTAASVGHARGVILYVLNAAGIPIFEYNPRQVKMALTGFGAADKPQMQKMVQRLLSLRELPRPDDAADALAIALCHHHTRPMRTSLNAIPLPPRVGEDVPSRPTMSLDVGTAPTSSSHGRTVPKGQERGAKIFWGHHPSPVEPKAGSTPSPTKGRGEITL